MLKILQYKGTSWVSKAIRWQTRSSYSHTALQTSSGIFEAWHIGGVRVIDNPFDGHDPCEIDVYTLSETCHEGWVVAFLKEQLGKKYSYWDVMRFVSRRQAPADDRWFCSELVLSALSVGGLDILRGNPAHMSPRDVALSPYLRLSRTIW